MQRSFVRNKNGGDHTISLSDWWRQDWRLKIEEYALCKTHLLIIDGKTKSVFMGVEQTVNTLLHFRGNKGVNLGKKTRAKQILGSVNQLSCVFTP